MKNNFLVASQCLDEFNNIEMLLTKPLHSGAYLGGLGGQPSPFWEFFSIFYGFFRKEIPKTPNFFSKHKKIWIQLLTTFCGSPQIF